MPRIEDIRYGTNPFRQRNRIEEALMPALKKTQSPYPDEPKERAPQPKPRHRTKKFLLTLLALVMVASFVAGVRLIYKQYKTARSGSADTTLEEVGKLMALPDEEPTIATVSDLASLKGEPFFANAAVGDRVLIYSAAKEAILYRPSTKKIIIVAPIR